ncbi:MAG: helix-turn-helix transcriptional regulator [Pseudomonadota bacterium]
MKSLLSTKEVAEMLDVNEKMVYNLISEKKLPATKVTGKWLFPTHLVEQWLDNSTINRPVTNGLPSTNPGLLVIAGSNDILLETALSIFNAGHPECLAVYGNLGSLGGLHAVKRSLAHIAASHLFQEVDGEYNFKAAEDVLGETPAVVNFCLREQCILIPKGNPKEINDISALGRPGIRIVNRPEGTGTRLLFDQELRKTGMDGAKISGYEQELHRHLDVGLEVLSGRADAGPAVTAVAGLLDLDFIPLKKERFDLLIRKSLFFDRTVQSFLGLLHEAEFRRAAEALPGYDLSICGRMVFPRDRPARD